MTYNILDLPAELLVFIISFLSSRDVVKLAYVSKSITVFTEVPTLWRKFVWPFFRICEETSVSKVMKVHGNHIRQLSFTNDDRLSSNLYGDLVSTTCANVINLTLLTQVPLTYDKLEKILQNLKHLKKLEITWSKFYYPAILLKRSNLTEVTLHIDKFQTSGEHHYWIQAYISAGYVPQCVNVIHKRHPYNNTHITLPVLNWWSNHSTRDRYRPPDGYTAHFKLYSNYRVPFNVSPRFHIQFGLTPLVKVNKFRIVFYKGIHLNKYGVMGHCSVHGQQYFILKLNHCSCSDLSCKCDVVSVSVDESLISYDDAHFCQVRDVTNNTASVVSVNDVDNILDKNLEQLSLLIPNLQRLNLSNHDLSKDNMRGLRAVASNCPNLKGLNLANSHAVPLNRNLETTNLASMHAVSLYQMELWKIISGMKLTHLTMESCLIASAGIYNQPEKVNLFATLQVIEISTSGRFCDACTCLSCKHFLCLSQFTSLQYCTLFHNFSYHSNLVQDISTTCKKLKFLSVESVGIYEELPFHPTGISLSSTCNNNLEQLSIISNHAIVCDEFMESVSAHGGLVRVILGVSRITEKGVGTLIENSPNLMEMLIILPPDSRFDLSTLQIILKKKRIYQKLIARGNFTMDKTTESDKFLLKYLLFNNVVQPNSDFFPLW